MIHLVSQYLYSYKFNILQTDRYLRSNKEIKEEVNLLSYLNNAANSSRNTEHG